MSCAGRQKFLLSIRMRLNSQAFDLELVSQTYNNQYLICTFSSHILVGIPSLGSGPISCKGYQEVSPIHVRAVKLQGTWFGHSLVELQQEYLICAVS